MLFQQLNRSDADVAKIVVYNSEASYTLLGNQAACLDFRAATASYGNAVCSPITSNLGLFVGIVDADIAAGAFGLIQTYGARQSVNVNVGGSSISAAGLVVGPGAALSSLQSLGAGKSWQLGPVIVMDNDVSGTTAYVRAFIRLL